MSILFICIMWLRWYSILYKCWTERDDAIEKAVRTTGTLVFWFEEGNHIWIWPHRNSRGIWWCMFTVQQILNGNLRAWWWLYFIIGFSLTKDVSIGCIFDAPFRIRDSKDKYSFFLFVIINHVSWNSVLNILNLKWPLYSVWLSARFTQWEQIMAYLMDLLVNVKNIAPSLPRDFGTSYYEHVELWSANNIAVRQFIIVWMQ